MLYGLVPGILKMYLFVTGKRKQVDWLIYQDKKFDIVGYQRYYTALRHFQFQFKRRYKSRRVQ